MSPKRPTVPTWTRRRAVARRWFCEIWGELRTLRAERAEASDRAIKPADLSEPRSTGSATIRRNPWPRCTACHRRQQAAEYECGEPEHAEICNDCCGCPRAGRGGGAGSCSCSGGCDCADRDDEREDEDYGDEQDAPDQAEGIEEGEQR